MIQLDLYLDEITNFLRTVTIKNSYFAESIKLRTIASRGIESLTDEANPYYLNISGEYTPEDTPIYLFSVDTGTTVLFNKDFVTNHPKTISLYKLPNTRYYDLCSQYPSQTDLIKSIVYPIDASIDPIAAENYTLLGYNDTVLDINERESLLEVLRTTLAIFRHRWDVKEYITEEYYPIVTWSMMWYVVYTKLLTQRMKNLRTTKVHSYHIWEYLSSKGLNDYRSILSNEQQLFLYQNINYLLKNKGKTSNLKILSEELLDPYGVILNAKSVILSTEDSIINCTTTPLIVSEDLYSSTTPTQNFKDGYESVETIVTRMHNDGLELDSESTTIASTTNTLQKANKTYIPTKLVELKKIPLNNRYVNLYYQLLLQSLVYGYTEGRVQYYVSINLPLSATYKTFNLGEAIALLNYCICKENNIDIDDIPTKISLDTVYKTSIGTPPSTFTHGVSTYNLNSYIDVDTMLEAIPQWPASLYSGSKFIDHMDLQFYVMKSNLMELYLSGDVLFHRAMKTFYNTILEHKYLDIDLIPGYTSYQSWFDANSDLKTAIELHDIAADPISAYNAFGTKLLENTIPVEKSNNINLTGLNETQYEKMKALFMQLCSYNIAFLDTDRNTVSTLTSTPITKDKSSRSSGTTDNYDFRDTYYSSSGISSTTKDMSDYLIDEINRKGSITTYDDKQDLAYELRATRKTSNCTYQHRSIQTVRTYISDINTNDIVISSKY